MKSNCLLSLLLVCFLFTGLAGQDGTTFPRGAKAPNVHHTGDVWLHHVSDADENIDYNVATAAFAAGAKLDWHLHPAGQQLLIVDGIGYYQERDQPVRIVRKGDVVKCTPGIEHWHAATPDHGVTYLAITGNQKTQWADRVSEEDYRAIDGPGLLKAAIETEIIQLSKGKWRWMADKNVAELKSLFLDESMFVHMGGSWGKERELKIIESGGIHYKHAEIFETTVNVIDDTAVLLSRITLLAVVGGAEVSNPFMVTEVFKKVDGRFGLASLSFTKLMREN